MCGGDGFGVRDMFLSIEKSCARTVGMLQQREEIKPEQFKRLPILINQRPKYHSQEISACVVQEYID